MNGADLFEYQRSAGQAVADSKRGLYLGDEPGLGKTRTAIAALLARGSQRPLVVCPAIVRSHWLREFDAMQWYRMRQRPVGKSYDEIVRGGEILKRELQQDYCVDALVLDEAHALKHFASKRTQILLGPGGYAREVPFVIPMSGTPITKNPFELCPPLFALYPEVAIAHGLRTPADFKNRFCYCYETFVRHRLVERIRPQVRNGDEFRAILGEIMLRRTTADVGLDMPEIFWQTLSIDAATDYFAGMAPEGVVAGLADQIEAGELEEIAHDPHVARMRRRLGELKAPIVGAMIADQLANSEDKLVVFAHHRNVLDALATSFREFEIARVDGDTSPAMREDARDRFVNGTARVFLGQNIACKEGLDGLQYRAHRAVMVEPDWTGAVNYQLGKRLARIGQERGVIVQMVVLVGTLDDAIVTRNLRETRLAAELDLGTEIVMV